MISPLHRRRLLSLFLIASLITTAVAITCYALRDNLNLFFTPSECIAGKAPINKTIRVGGMVMKGSIHRDPKSLGIRFDITDYKRQITIEYKGILPDLFREGQGIVASGQWTRSKHFVAKEVLAKHDENYMPPELNHLQQQKRNP